MPIAALRAEPGVLAQNRRGQSGLWSYSISGDLPIVLVQIADPANIELVRQLVQAQAYWRLKGLAVDLMIWNEDHSGYRQELHDQILGLISAGADGIVKDRPGGIFVRPSDQIAGEDRILFQSVARAILSDSRGSLAEQVASGERLEPAAPELAPVRAYRPERAIPAAPRRDLIFFNGLGGFTPDGREYIITTTPAPGNARALGERAGERELRNRGLRERPGLYLGGKRARVPPDSVGQRSGERHRRRGVLSAR